MADNTTISSMTGGDVIATDDIGGVKYQRTKTVWGADGTATDVSATAGLPVQSAFLEASGSASADGTNLFSVDVAGYRWVSVQVTAVASGFATWQASNDNVNWQNVYLSRPDSNSTDVNWFVGSTSIWVGPLFARYFRVRTNSWSSGTTTAVANFSVDPGAVASSPLRVLGFNNTSTSDGAAIGAAFNIRALNDLWNGATYDRWRSFGTLGAAGVTPVAGTSGGWDKSFTAALTTTKVAVKTSAGNVGGFLVYNPNAAASYVQVFDVASGSVTLGTTSPTWVIPVQANAHAHLQLTCPITHATAITIAATTTATGSTAPATAGLPTTILFK